VSVEAKVTTIHVHYGTVASGCTEINNLDMDGTTQLFAHVMGTSVQYAMAEYLPNPKTGLTYIPVQECQLATCKKDPEDKALAAKRERSGLMDKAHTNNVATLANT
jgi:hypothetical protein